MTGHRPTLDVLVVLALALLNELSVLVPRVERAPARSAVLFPVVVLVPGGLFLGGRHPRSAADGSPPDSRGSGRWGAREIDGGEDLGPLFPSSGGEGPADPTAEDTSRRTRLHVAAGGGSG